METNSKRALGIMLACFMAASVLLGAGICVDEKSDMIVYAEEAENAGEGDLHQTANKTFSDIKKTYWAYDAITELCEEGIVSGYPDGSFKPGNSVTYGEFIKLAYTACSGKSAENASGAAHWAENYYYAAAADGYFDMTHINSGTLGMKIPRKHMAHIASKIITGSSGINHMSLEEADEMFTDVNAASEYSYDIMKASSIGVLTGYEDRSFGAEKTLTRAEAAVVIVRLKEYMDEQKSISEAELQEDEWDQNRNEIDTDTGSGSETGKVIVRKAETGSGVKPVIYHVIESRMQDKDITKLEYANDGTIRIYSEKEYPFIFIMLENGTILSPIGFPGGFSVKEGKYYVFVADTEGNTYEKEKMYFMFEDGSEVYRFTDITI